MEEMVLLYIILRHQTMYFRSKQFVQIFENVVNLIVNAKKKQYSKK